MTDPGLQGLTELPRRMTATLDLRAVGEALTSRAIDATGAATGAIALWDRQHDRLTTLADLEAEEVPLSTPAGRTYPAAGDRSWLPAAGPGAPTPARTGSR